MDSWGILNVDTAAAAISRDDMTSSFRRKQTMDITMPFHPEKDFHLQMLMLLINSDVEPQIDEPSDEEPTPPPRNKRKKHVS
ncbi:hypothetical protein KGM_213229 [Danaus plexippus plexippus]|uniref:Uncharacterized protein n=1 Tax=Danaus plexippus plexippus TaxID=278856 RepID=A0A212EP98_DANPL|nr:hypothetical protein KGM_213229 [Danaus plexippus plexippus]